MDQRRALEIIEEGIQRAMPSVELSTARLLFERDVTRGPSFATAPSQALHRIDAEGPWSEILDPQRNWIAVSLLFDDNSNPYLIIDLGPLSGDLRREDARGVDIGITVSIAKQPLRIAA